MDQANTFIQVLSVITIVLCAVLYTALKISSRFKSRALGKRFSGRLANLRVSGTKIDTFAGRNEFKFPVVCETPHGEMAGELSAISLPGAFVNCQEPLPIGETFHLSLTAGDQQKLTLQAQVLWNNITIPEDKVVNRGMKISFLRLSEEDRKFIEAMVSNYVKAEFDINNGPPWAD